jgi:hypothetical protein
MRLAFQQVGHLDLLRRDLRGLAAVPTVIPCSLPHLRVEACLAREVLVVLLVAVAVTALLEDLAEMFSDPSLRRFQTEMRGGQVALEDTMDFDLALLTGSL